MDLHLTPEEVAFRDELGAWLGNNIPKDWNEWRERPLGESFPYLRAWQRKLHEGGWGGCFPAKRIRWSRRHVDGAGDFRGADGASGRAADGERAGSGPDRADDHRRSRTHCNPLRINGLGRARVLLQPLHLYSQASLI